MKPGGDGLWSSSNGTTVKIALCSFKPDGVQFSDVTVIILTALSILFIMVTNEISEKLEIV